MTLRFSGCVLISLAVAVNTVGCAKERPFSDEVLPAQPAAQPASESAPSPRGEGPRPLVTNCTEGGCPAGLVCDTTGACVECVTSGDCVRSAAPICDSASGTCVACVGNADCPTSAPFCQRSETSGVANVCIQCLADADCGGSSPVCDLATNTCTGRCQESTQCSGQTPLCDQAEQVCVQCLVDSDCPALTPHCNSVLGRCIECRDSAECVGEFNAHCLTEPMPVGTSNTCVGCISDRDCGNKTGIGPICRLTDGRCVNCLTDDQCADSPETSICLLSGACGPCAVDQDCTLISGRNACAVGVGCVECTEESHCAGTSQPVCNVPTPGAQAGAARPNTCVQCVTNANCPDPSASRCENNVCIACASNSDCVHVDATAGAAGGTLGVCDQGTCVECTGTQREACGAAVCNSLTRTCAPFPPGSARSCDECVSDAQCDDGSRCVQQVFEGTPVGFFCFPLATGTASGCGTVLAVSVTTNTIDGEQQVVCAPRRTTCPSIKQQAEPCTTDDDCGVPGLNDGVCGELAGEPQCTMPCTVTADCNGDCLPGQPPRCSL